MSAAPITIIEQSLKGEKATVRLGEILSSHMKAGDLVLLHGDLGSGKTTLARALIQSHLARHGQVEDVPSPTFTLIQTYESIEFLLTHADLYRIEDPSELRELGLAEALDEGVVLVEWPERAEDEMERLSRDRLDIFLSIMPEGIHHVRLEGKGAWASRLGGIAF